MDPVARTASQQSSRSLTRRLSRVGSSSLSRLGSSSSSGIKVQRPRKASYRFSECDGDGDLPQFQGSKGVQYFAALAANMGSLALGTAYSWSAVALPDLRVDESISMSDTEESWIGSMITLGAVASGPAAGFAIEKLGRRWTMLIVTLPFLAGWLLIGFANSVTLILLGRFVTGFCGGVYAVAAPIFMAEMADVSIRGTLCAGFDMMNSAGIMLIYIYGAFVSWRMQAFISATLPVVIFVMMLFVPESPRYLIQKEKFEEAILALMKYRGAAIREQVEPELSALRVSLRNSQEKSQSWASLLQKPVLQPVSIAFFIYLFQVLTGVDPVLLFTVDIFSASGTAINEYFSTIIIGIVSVVASGAGAFLVEYFGRRILLMISELSMVLSLSALGFYFFLKEGQDSPPAGLDWLPLTSLIIYIISYSVGVGPGGYMIMGEILPHQVKGAAGSILTSVKWFMSFAMTKFFLDLIALLGSAGCYWLFAGFCFSGCIYIFFCVPETKGKTLEEIQLQFSNSRPPSTNTSSTRRRMMGGGDDGTPPPSVTEETAKSIENSSPPLDAHLVN